jgi:hypothetical protein
MRVGKLWYYFFIVFIVLISLSCLNIKGQCTDTITKGIKEYSAIVKTDARDDTKKDEPAAGFNAEYTNQDQNDDEDDGLYTQIIAKHKEVYNDHSYKAVFELRDLFLRFFRTEESLSFDFRTYGYASRYISSDDGLIGVFSWDTANGYSPATFDSLLQYRASNGELKTVSIPQMLANITKRPEPDSLLKDYEYHDYSFYEKIVRLKAF